MNPFDLTGPDPDPVYDDRAYQLGAYLGLHWALEEFGDPGAEDVAVWKVLQMLPAHAHNLKAAESPKPRPWQVPDLRKVVDGWRGRTCKQHGITAANLRDPLFVHGFVCGAVQVFREAMEAVSDHFARRRESLFENQEIKGDLFQLAAPAPPRPL